MLMGIGRDEGAKDSDLCTFASWGKSIRLNKKRFKDIAFTTLHSVSSATGRLQTVENLKLRRAWFSIRSLLTRLLLGQVFRTSLQCDEMPTNHADEAQMKAFHSTPATNVNVHFRIEELCWKLPAIGELLGRKIAQDCKCCCVRRADVCLRCADV